MVPHRACSPVAHEGSEQQHQSHDLERGARNTWVTAVFVFAEAPGYDRIRDTDGYIKRLWPGWLGRTHGFELVAESDKNAEENMGE